MHEERHPLPTERPAFAATVPCARDFLSTVVYTSKAVTSLSPPELQQLTRVSQVRNGKEAITGVLLHDADRFYQWLEGPADGVSRVMGSICNDARHTDIEVLTDRAAQARMFADWSMKLAAHDARFGELDDVLPAPPEVIQTLRQRPHAAPTLLVKLVPGSPVASTPAGCVGDVDPTIPPDPKVHEILRRVMLSTAVPAMVDRRAPLAAVRRRWPAHPQVRELAHLLIASDQRPAFELIRSSCSGNGWIGPLYPVLLEPVARTLGDLWRDDACSEVDVTRGLVRLQALVRLAGTNVSHPTPDGSRHPAVLIVPEPDEPHWLAAVLDSDVLENAGWSPRCAYPEDDDEVQDLVAATWFDVLDLSLSVAFRREDWLPRVARTIARARQASLNPALHVVVGGRIFVEEDSACASVGADLASQTALRLDRSISELMRMTREGVAAATH